MMEEHFFKNPNSTAQFYSFFDTVLFYVTVTGDGSREPYNQALHEEMKPGSTRLT